MAPLRNGWARGRTERSAAPGLWSKLAFPLITATLVLLLGAALFGLAS
jgi:hypothetical protein